MITNSELGALIKRIRNELQQLKKDKAVVVSCRPFPPLPLYPQHGFSSSPFLPSLPLTHFNNETNSLFQDSKLQSAQGVADPLKERRKEDMKTILDLNHSLDSREKQLKKLTDERNELVSTSITRVLNIFNNLNFKYRKPKGTDTRTS